MLTSWSTPREGTFRGMACTVLSWQVGRCAVVAWVLRDEPRVFIGGGEFGDSPVREADVVEVDALAERVGSAELRDALVRMRSLAQ
ncbi:MAG: hypothetical protein JWO38_4035 [Gemmataceae bacterium]|nr:hypothetical protein [Gemmataceae bacterium]